MGLEFTTLSNHATGSEIRFCTEIYDNIWLFLIFMEIYGKYILLRLGPERRLKVDILNEL